MVVTKESVGQIIEFPWGNFESKKDKKTGKRITITQFLNHPTARGIAAQLSKQDRPTYDYVHLVSENLAGLPIFVFSGSRLAYALKKQKPAATQCA